MFLPVATGKAVHVHEHVLVHEHADEHVHANVNEHVKANVDVNVDVVVSVGLVVLVDLLVHVLVDVDGCYCQSTLPAAPVAPTLPPAIRGASRSVATFTCRLPTADCRLTGH